MLFFCIKFQMLVMMMSMMIMLMMMMIMMMSQYTSLLQFASVGLLYYSSDDSGDRTHRMPLVQMEKKPWGAVIN